MQARTVLWAVAALMATSLIAHRTAQAGAVGIGASENKDRPETITNHDLVKVDGKLGWSIEKDVFYDPTQGPWVKRLSFNKADNYNNSTLRKSFSYNESDGYLQASLFLAERLTITGTESWSDWHEKIRGLVIPEPDGMIGDVTFKWGDIKVFEVKKPGDYKFREPSGLSAQVDGNKLDLQFDPLPVGTVLKIVKEIKLKLALYEDDIDSLRDCAEYLDGVFLEVAQFPTVPVPAAVWPGLALLSGLWLRRSRSRVA
ncbi:MAG TPA: hypothetical protein VF184_10640 [Phycisphaeraceae bacterium]